MYSGLQQLARLPGRAGAGLTPMQVFMWPETTPRWQNGVLLIGVRHVPGLNQVSPLAISALAGARECTPINTFSGNVVPSGI